MSKCSYTYVVMPWKDTKVLCLEDKNMGMSLTNGMEDVIKELKVSYKSRGIPFPTKIIYRDTDGNWDGWNQDEESFILLGTKDRAQALDKITK